MIYHGISNLVDIGEDQDTKPNDLGNHYKRLHLKSSLEIGSLERRIAKKGKVANFVALGLGALAGYFISEKLDSEIPLTMISGAAAIGYSALTLAKHYLSDVYETLTRTYEDNAFLDSAKAIKAIAEENIETYEKNKSAAFT